MGRKVKKPANTRLTGFPETSCDVSMVALQGLERPQAQNQQNSLDLLKPLQTNSPNALEAHSTFGRPAETNPDRASFCHKLVTTCPCCGAELQSLGGTPVTSGVPSDCNDDDESHRVC